MKLHKNRTAKRKLNKILPIVKRKGNKYVYVNQTLNHLSIRKKKGPQSQFKNVKRVKEILESELLRSEASSNFSLLEPSLIINAREPQFKMPQYLDVAIHEGERVDYSGDITYCRVTAAELFEQIKNSKETNLGFNLSVPQMELAKGDYTLPQIVQEHLEKLQKVNMWMYCGDRQTDWHYDGHDNFLYVLKGEKIVFLAQPKAISPRNVFSLYNNHCGDRINTASLSVLKARVKNGTCVYIPKGWWHKVYSYGNPSLAVNYWGNSINQILRNFSPIERNLVLKSLLFSLSDGICKKAISEWGSFLQEKKQLFRTRTSHRLIDQMTLGMI